MNQTNDFDAFLQDLIDAYQRDGYSVVVEPGPSRLPKDLKSVRPDLLARRGNERIVVEIKKPGVKRPSEQTRALASALEAHENWRLDVVVYDPVETRRMRVAGTATIKRSLRESRDLYDAGQTAAAMLLAWSAFEASAMRAIAHQTGEPASTRSTAELLKNLVFHGLLPEQELSELSRVADKRNRTAHGGLNVKVSVSEFERVRDLTIRLLDPNALEVT